jgi:hypothetical protein
MRQCPETPDLAAVMCRLRAVGPTVRVIRSRFGRSSLVRDDDARSDALDSILRNDFDYSEARYRIDIACARAAYLKAATYMGDMVLKQMQVVALQYTERYLGKESGGNLNDLMLAIRDWLPFVSDTSFVSMPGDRQDLPSLDPTPKLAALQRLGVPAGGPAAQTTLADVEQAVTLRDARFTPWRSLDPDSPQSDPRRQVLQQTKPPGNEQDLKYRLYGTHSILLLLPSIVSPREIYNLLHSPAPVEALAKVIGRAVDYLNESIATFRSELGKEKPDWNHFDPLLKWAATFIGAREPDDPLRQLLDEIREDIKPWTVIKTINVACFIIGIVVLIVATNVGGVVAFGAATIDFAVQTAGVAANLYLTKNESELRQRLNRFEHIDAALQMANGPESTTFTVAVGVLTLAAGAVGLGGAFRTVAQDLGEAANNAARLAGQAAQASVPGTKSGAEVAALSKSISASEAGVGREIAGEAPPTSMAADTPAAAQPTARPPTEQPGAAGDTQRSARAEPGQDAAVSARPDHTEVEAKADQDPTSDAPGSSAGRSEEPELQPELQPIVKRSRFRWQERAQELDQELADFQATIDQTLEMGITPELADQIADFEKLVAEASQRMEQLSTEVAVAGSTGGGSTAQTALAENELADLQAAIDLGLARLSREDRGLWLAMLDQATKEGAEGAGAFQAATERGLAAEARGTVRPPSGRPDTIGAAALELQRRMTQAFQKPLSETPELERLWNQARANTSDWNRARETFWALVRTGTGDDAEFAREMLRQGGFVFRANSEIGTAPILEKHIPAFTEKKALEWAGDDPDRLDIVNRLIDARNSGNVPLTDFPDRILTFDHAVARANQGAVLDPSNLNFMLGRDNSFKGDRF